MMVMEDAEAEVQYRIRPQLRRVGVTRVVEVVMGNAVIVRRRMTTAKEVTV